MGITKKERRWCMKWNCFWAFLYLLAWLFHSIVTLFYFAIAYAARQIIQFDSKDNWLLAIALLCYDITFFIKMIVNFVFLCKWRNQKIDPTVVISRIEFKLFFTLGLFEFITIIFTIFMYFKVHKAFDQFEVLS